MIVAIAAGQQPRLTANPLVPIETMTAYIVQVSLGDTPQGTLEYRTIFAVGMLLFLMTFVLNLVEQLAARALPRGVHLMAVGLGRRSASSAARRRADLVFQAAALVVLVVALGGAGRARRHASGATAPAGSTGSSSRASRRGAPTSAGIYHALVGSLYVIALTAALALPIGVAAAIYLEEYGGRSRLARFIELNIANLAGVPSIIYGLLGLGPVRARAWAWAAACWPAPPRWRCWCCRSSSSRRARRCARCRARIREGSYALGATKWQTIWHQVLPMALPGILTGLILALSRAIGETAPLITIGALTYVPFAPDSIWSPFTVLPIQIFNWVSRPQAAFQENAAAGILVLLALLLTMNAIAIVLRDRYQRKRPSVTTDARPVPPAAVEPGPTPARRRRDGAGEDRRRAA